MNPMDVIFKHVVLGCLMALVYATYEERWGHGGGIAVLLFITGWTVLMLFAEAKHFGRNPER